MFNVGSADTGSKEADIWDSLMALKANTPSSVLKMRTSGRIEVRSRVLLRYGNASQRDVAPIEGTTADISQGGCQVVTPRPLWVGDYFLIEFDPQHLDAPPTMGRCLRCRMLNEDAFEIGMKFNSPLQIAL
jgi:hypothetical protein